VQCMQYAARVAELIDRVTGSPLEAELIDRVAAARSNVADEGDGRRIWQRRVASSRVGADEVCAHVAVHLLVEPHSVADVEAFRVALSDRVDRRSGRARMIAARCEVRSQLTDEATQLCFAGLYLGEQHVTGGVRAAPPAETWAAVVEELADAFKTADVFASQRVIDRHFTGRQLSLGSLLPGHRERVLAAVLGDAIRHAEDELGDAFDRHAPLIRWLVARALPVPEVLHMLAEAAMRRRVLANLRSGQPSFPMLRQHMVEAVEVQVELDTAEIALAASEALRRLIDRLADPATGDLDPAALDTVARAADVAARMHSAVDLWFAQNATWRLLERVPALRVAGKTAMVTDLERLARALGLAVPS